MAEVVGVKTQEATCQACKKTLYVEAPAVCIDNRPEYSMILFVHQRTEACPHCGRELAAFIVNLDRVNVELAWMPVTRQQPPAQTQAKVLVRPGHEN